jgi:hypothetical protein
MNTAIANVNKSLTVFKDRINKALSPLVRLRTNSRNAAAQLKNVKTEGDKAASKLNRVKTEGEKAQRSLDKVRTAARNARSELKLLGNTKSAPTVGAPSGAVPAIRPMTPMAGLGAAAAGVTAVAAVIAPMIAQGDQAKKTAKQTEFLIRMNSGLGTTSKTAADRINALAGELSVSTGQTKSNITAAQQLFLKYGPLATEVGKAGGAFDKATELSTNLAVVLGTDAPGAAQILIDALRNTETAIGDLEAQGITFTDEEKKKYDALVKTKDPLDEQYWLLDKLKGKYSGLATEYVTATDKVSRRVDIFWESMNKGMSNWAESFADPLETFFKFFDLANEKDPKKKTAISLDIFSWFKKNFGSLATGSFGYASGGYVGRVKNYAPGGPVVGPGTGTSDSISAMLSNGEFVVNAKATAQNRSLLEAINSNQSVPASAPNIYVTVNPSAKMDERELAAQVSRQIAFEIRKGGY